MIAAMKDSGIEWIGDIPTSWSCKKIKYCYKFETGFTPDTSVPEYYDPDGATWVSISDLTSAGRTIDSSSEGVSDLFLKQKHPKPVPKGSLLYSFKLSVGKCAFANKPLFTNEAIASFLPSSKNDLGFLYYASSLIVNNANENIYQAKLLNSRLIANAPIPVPSIREQQSIAHYLDVRCAEIDDEANVIEKQLSKLESYRASIIHEAVTCGLDPNVPTKPSGIVWINDIPENWMLRKIKHLLKTFESGTSVRAANYPADKGEKGVLSLSAVFGGKYNPQANKRIDDDELVRASCHVKTGCLLISRCNTSELVGLPAYVEKGDRSLYLPDKIWQLDSGQKDINRFIYYAMQSKHAREYCAVMSVGSSESMQNIASSDLLNMYIAIPVRSDEAKHIADYLDAQTAAIDAVLETKRKQLDTLKRLRQSLIYEYVTGKRRVTEEA